MRSLARVGDALGGSGSLDVALRAVVAACTPSLFSGISIATGAAEGLPEISVSFGTLDGETLALDLAAHGTCFGKLVVAQPPLVRFDDIDRDVARDLASRLALTLHAAHAIAREHRVANTLQRALLPESLPQSPRIKASAAYLPGTREAIVGGDWYDVFDLPDGRMAFSIGDVAGHGLHAAVIMGEVRQAFRAAAVNPKSPSLVLERANTIVNMRADTAIVTAIFGILDRETSTVTYAVAGHPPPILAARGVGTHTLPACGIPLGIAESVYTQDWTFTLPPGSLFTLYTDGLTEHSRDIMRGEEQLIAAIAAQIGAPSAEPARAIVNRVFEDIDNADDVAALVLAIEDDAPQTFHFEFSALPLAVPIMRRALAQFLDRHGVVREEADAVLLAVGEAAANAVEHAYSTATGIVRVRAAFTGDTLVIDVIDAGRWKPAEQREERGRGIRIMRALMDRIEIRTMQAETSVRLTARIATTALNGVR